MDKNQLLSRIFNLEKTIVSIQDKLSFKKRILNSTIFRFKKLIVKEANSKLKNSSLEMREYLFQDINTFLQLSYILSHNSNGYEKKMKKLSDLFIAMVEISVDYLDSTSGERFSFPVKNMPEKEFTELIESIFYKVTDYRNQKSEICGWGHHYINGDYKEAYLSFKVQWNDKELEE